MANPAREKGRKRAGWFSQFHGGYNSNPNLSNCPRSSHYTADLIQTFVVAEVKGKFKTAATSFAQTIACACIFPRAEICAARISLSFSAEYALLHLAIPAVESFRTARKRKRRENYVAKLPILQIRRVSRILAPRDPNAERELRAQQRRGSRWEKRTNSRGARRMQINSRLESASELSVINNGVRPRLGFQINKRLRGVK